MAPQQPKYVTTADGRRITYERWQYEQTVQQEAVLKRVNDLITNDAANAVSVGAGFSQQDFGGLLREVVPNLLDQYGMVNATAAIDFYNEMYDKFWITQDLTKGIAQRAAAKQTQGVLAVAQGYAAKYADTYDVIGKSDTVINYAMKIRAKYGHAPSVQAMNNALTREVAMYHRDTILFNSALDPTVEKVQRVAQANACGFCRLMALGSTSGEVRTSTYAAKFHNHCHCTIQPLFKGDKPVRPDYYDEFEKEYAEIHSGSTKDMVAEWQNVIAEKASIPEVIPEWLPNTNKNSEKLSLILGQQYNAGFTRSNLTEMQYNAIRSYEAAGYGEINGLLRASNPVEYVNQLGNDPTARLLKIRDRIQAIDETIKAAPVLKEPILSRRIVEGDFAETLLKLKIGSSFQDLGFVSTTLSDEIVELRTKWSPNHAVIEIINPAGTKGIFPEPLLYGKGNISEGEWLLERGTTFLIQKIEGRTITVKVKQNG